MDDRLATIDKGRKLKGLLLLGELGGYLTRCPLVEAYIHTKWHLHQCSHLAPIDIGGKLWAVPHLWAGGTGCLT